MSIPLSNVLNFRDVGLTINTYLGERRLREGVFYRSARPDEATARDRLVLTEELALRTIIDLRTQTERVEQIEKLNARSTQTLTPQALRIDGISYREIKLTGRALERFFLSQLSWWGFFTFFILYFLGLRLRAIGVISREVMLPRGLIGLAVDTLDHSGAELREALAVYTDAGALPSVVHCTQGKDRTGLICALVLMILDVPLPAIEHDYFLTDAALKADETERIAEIRAIGLTEDWGRTAEGMIPAIDAHVQQRYGGLEGYLDDIGFGEGERRRVREALLY